MLWAKRGLNLPGCSLGSSVMGANVKLYLAGRQSRQEQTRAEGKVAGAECATLLFVGTHGPAKPGEGYKARWRARNAPPCWIVGTRAS